jgi:hypothetical protein
MYVYERLKSAIDIANMQLTGIPDKLGYPSIMHSVRVMSNGDSSNESDLIERILHDVAEDTNVSVEDLAIMVPLLPDEAVVLQALTHRKNEPYMDYITRIVRTGPQTTMIKTDDINDNLSRLDGLPEEDIIRLREKYSKALCIINNLGAINWETQGRKL